MVLSSIYMYLQFKDDFFRGPKTDLSPGPNVLNGFFLRASGGLRGRDWRSSVQLGQVVLECGKMIDSYGLSLIIHDPGQTLMIFWWRKNEPRVHATFFTWVRRSEPFWKTFRVGLYHFVALSCEEKAKSSSVLWAKQQQWLTSHCLTDSAGTQNHPMASRWLCCRMSQLYIYTYICICIYWWYIRYVYIYMYTCIGIHIDITIRI